MHRRSAEEYEKHECLLYKAVNQENKTVQCTCCSHYCTIGNHRLGICGTRYNMDGKLISLVYGRPVALHVDPMEKKPLYHYNPGANIFSTGTSGCCLGCLFCQNSSLSATRGTNGSPLSDLEDFFAEETGGRYVSPAGIVNATIRQGCKYIAATYNDPAIWFEYFRDIVLESRKRNAGIKFVSVTSGFMSKEQQEIIIKEKLVQAANIDLKSFRDETYRKIMGARLQPVLDCIKNFHNNGIHVEVTTLLIPTVNDSAEELTDIAKFIYSVDPKMVWHISAFHPSYKMMDKPRTTEAQILKAIEIGRKNGLVYVYGGNINGTDRSNNTYCAKCDALLIDRDRGYDVQIVNMDPATGVCMKCGQRSDIVIDN